MPTGQLERRPCAKGCGWMLDPRGAAQHERKCDGTPRESRPHTARPIANRKPACAADVAAGRSKNGKTTAVAVRGRVERAVAVARRRQPLLTLPMLYERIRQQIADRETTIRILGELEAAL